MKRAPADVDVIGVVSHGQGVRRALDLHQGDDLVWAHRTVQIEQAPHGGFGDRSGALMAGDGDSVDGGDVDGGPGCVL